MVYTNNRLVKSGEKWRKAEYLKKIQIKTKENKNILFFSKKAKTKNRLAKTIRAS